MEKYIKIAEGYRKILHEMPEASMHEEKTKKTIIDILSRDTCLKIHDCGKYIYASWEGNGENNIALRADFDAVVAKDGTCKHVCGHDGHTAIMLAMGVYISDIKPDRRVILLFQPGEETGEGAKICSEMIEKEGIKEIYGMHNIPSKELGHILIKKGTFACASTGLEIKLEGSPTHAAYPELGINPAMGVAELINETDSLVKNRKTDGHLNATPIGVDMGSASYGMAASSAVIRYTVRGEKPEDYDYMVTSVNSIVKNIADRFALKYTIKKIEEFPATVNNEIELENVKAAAEKSGLAIEYLDTPMRWSEDFGWYLYKTKGAFFGVGAGLDWEGLHTENYSFNDKVIPYALKIFAGLISQNIT